MPEVLNLITAYQLANNLIPGVVFAVVAGYLGYEPLSQQILVNTVLCLFLGIIISRLGSLVVEPILKRLKVVHIEPYGDFVEASRKEPKLELLYEINNSYRTYVALCLSLLALKGYKTPKPDSPPVDQRSLTIILVLLAVLFVFSYRKQSGYVAGRVTAHKDGAKH